MEPLLMVWRELPLPEQALQPQESLLELQLPAARGEQRRPVLAAAGP